jgi:hypothetical protein
MHGKQVTREKIAAWFRHQGRDESDLDRVVEQVIVANQRAGVYLRQLLRVGPNDPLPPEGWVARYHMRKSMHAIGLDVLCLDWGPNLTRLVGWRMRPDYEIHPDAETEFATWCQDDLGCSIAC